MIQRHRFFIILTVLLLIIVTVSANPVPRTRSIQLFLEMDTIPFNESVNYTMDCFGYFRYPTDHYEFLRKIAEDDPNPPMKVFSLTGTCPRYGCLVSLSTQSPPDAYWEPESSEICKLSISEAGKLIEIWNRSDQTGVLCSSRSDQWNVEKQIGSDFHYYRFTKEYYSCRKRLDSLGAQCQDFLINNSHETNNSSLTHNQCIDLYNHQSLLCDSNLQEINKTEINPAQYFCKFWFNMPSDFQILKNNEFRNESMSSSHSPVESLFCSLLHLLGMRC